ncbi:plasmid stabilization protein [Lysobacter arseniciresistens ZS79]|uniref:Plasmid stabilization protein n=1 Tax=Lysobacter arseniciresistens ZS79 TaxID=913325 RepID=A0A0A0F1A2_9GAMM|nr:type II toxin-antitoxin system RelE/ParE family toxin [Lysobacter arseniciresistens]KGM56564.1 plasmid stabilization protein [Lysobacter arseniciresistens ZS79]
MPRLIWTPEALQDLSRLHGFLLAKKEDVARRAIRAIRSGVAVLERHPAAGRPAADLEPEFREWLVESGAGGYVVLYRFDGADAVILAVRHAREAGY